MKIMLEYGIATNGSRIRIQINSFPKWLFQYKTNQRNSGGDEGLLNAENGSDRFIAVWLTKATVNITLLYTKY